MLWPKKIHTRNLITKKKIPAARKFPNSFLFRSPRLALRKEGRPLAVQWIAFSFVILSPSKRDSTLLKELYPVTVHAPNFDFWTACGEIKRCEESRRTLKNPFASRLTEFSTTLKLLRITDQWYNVPVKFRFGRNRDFFGVTFISVGRRTKRWEAFWCRLKTYFFCQFPYKLMTISIPLCKCFLILIT